MHGAVCCPAVAACAAEGAGARPGSRNGGHPSVRQERRPGRGMDEVGRSLSPPVARGRCGCRYRRVPAGRRTVEFPRVGQPDPRANVIGGAKAGHFADLGGAMAVARALFPKLTRARDDRHNNTRQLHRTEPVARRLGFPAGSASISVGSVAVYRGVDPDRSDKYQAQRPDNIEIEPRTG